MKDKETMDLWGNMDKFTEKKDYNKKMIASVEDEIINFSNDLAELKRIKINFYLSLLSQGFDCRYKNLYYCCPYLPIIKF